MFKKLLTILFIVASTASGMFFSLQGKYVHEKLLFNHVAPNIFKITRMSEQGSGSGSLVELDSGKQIVLTNRHVCEIRETDDTIKLIAADGTKSIQKVLLIDDKHDLCAIEAPAGSKGGLKLRSKALGISDHVFVVGHPSGRPISLQYGMIIDLKYSASINYGEPRPGEVCWGTSVNIEEELRKAGLSEEEIEAIKLFLGFENLCLKTLIAVMTTAPGEPGNSGSPVLDFYGNIVGVLFAGNGSPHMSLLVPHEDIQKFLQRL